jgi:hypothetical protein
MRPPTAKKKLPGGVLFCHVMVAIMRINFSTNLPTPGDDSEIQGVRKHTYAFTDEEGEVARMM